MSAWDDLVTAALLGSDRAPVPDLPVAAGAVPLLAQSEAEGPARRLLAGAAVYSLYRRAGVRAGPAPAALPSPAPADGRPPCSPQAALHLGEILRGSMSSLLAEWLQALAASGRALPHRWLPELLDLAAQGPELCPLILACLDERGYWLAAQGPAWRIVAGTRDPALAAAAWQAGSCEARVALLQALRAVDPDRARDLVASTWQEDPPDDRTAFLATFAAGLGPADEPFLEAALDDRNRKVRAQAADLLACLPSSRLVARMEERLRSLLSFGRGLLGAIPDRLWVAMPRVWDKGMARDGVVKREPRRLEQHAWWLVQMLSVVPPTTWCRAWRKQPREIIAALDIGEYNRIVLEGLTAAAVRHPDESWARALLERAAVDRWAVWLGQPPRGGKPSNSDLLVAAMPQAWLEETILDGLRRLRQEIDAYRARTGGLAFSKERMPEWNRLTASHLYQWAARLRSHRHPWSEELTRAFLTCLREVAGTELGHVTLWLGLRWDYESFAPYASPALLEEAERDWPPDEPWWKQRTRRFAATLRFRRDMLRALR